MSDTFGLTGIFTAASVSAMVYAACIALCTVLYLFSRNASRRTRALTILELLVPARRNGRSPQSTSPLDDQ